MPFSSLPADPDFQPNQIVCLDQDTDILFGEVVQMVPQRGLCWARPLAIARWQPQEFVLTLLEDLRQASDLLLPAQLFRAAIDTELLPLMAELFNPDKPLPPESSPRARRRLSQFIAQLCQAHPEVFR